MNFIETDMYKKCTNIWDLVSSIQHWNYVVAINAQKMKFSIKDVFRKCDQIRSENFIFCAVNVPTFLI